MPSTVTIGKNMKLLSFIKRVACARCKAILGSYLAYFNDRWSNSGGGGGALSSLITHLWKWKEKLFISFCSFSIPSSFSKVIVLLFTRASFFRQRALSLFLHASKHLKSAVVLRKYKCMWWFVAGSSVQQFINNLLRINPFFLNSIFFDCLVRVCNPGDDTERHATPCSDLSARWCVEKRTGYRIQPSVDQVVKDLNQLSMMWSTVKSR